MKSFEDIYKNIKQIQLFEHIYRLNELYDPSEVSAQTASSETTGNTEETDENKKKTVSLSGQFDDFLNQLSSLLGGSGDWSTGDIPPGPVGPEATPNNFNDIDSWKSDVFSRNDGENGERGIAWSKAPGYGNQCVALFRDYCRRILNLSEQPGGCVTTGGARDFWTQYENDAILNQNFTKIPYQQGVQPQMGDVAIWNDNSYGHIAIVIGRDPQSGQGISDQGFPVFEQNVIKQTAATRFVPYTYSNLFGFLRPNNNKAVANQNLPAHQRR